MFELADAKSVSSKVDEKLDPRAGKVLYLLGLRIAGNDKVNGIAGKGGARMLLREPAVLELIGAAGGG
jgi:hypothetical protein